MFQSQPQSFLPFPLCPPFSPFPDCDLFINNSGTGPQGPVGPQGPTGPAGPSGIPGLVPVTIVTATPYLADLTDYYLPVNLTLPSSVILPVSPTGTIFVVKDTSGAASTNAITVSASTTIDGVASGIINTNYGSITLIFNGVEWNII